VIAPRRTYAIGDLHGHHAELMGLYQKLVTEAPMDLTKDLLIFLGDIVDVGPKSKEVVSQIIKWQEEYNKPGELHVVCLYGNHEDLMVDALNSLHPIYNDPNCWLDQGGDETLKSYTPKLDKLSKKAFQKARKSPGEYLDPEHIRWISSLPYFYMDADYVFVHGGLPNLPLEVIIKASQNGDTKLNYDLIWLRDEFIYSNFDWGKRIIFAHTPVKEPLVTPRKIGLNTMPRNEGKLTALEIPTMRFFYQPKL